MAGYKITEWTGGGRAVLTVYSCHAITNLVNVDWTIKKQKQVNISVVQHAYNFFSSSEASLITVSLDSLDRTEAHLCQKTKNTYCVIMKSNYGIGNKSIVKDHERPVISF